MSDTTDYLIQRAKEPSTYVSLGMLLTAVGWSISPEHWQVISQFCMGLGGFIGMILAERKKTTAVEIKNVVQEVVKPEATKPITPTPEKLEAAMKNGGHS